MADLSVKEVICRFGVPLLIHSDQGHNFESAVFTEMCQMLGMHKTRKPQRITHNQKVERFNRTLEAQLAKFVDYHQRDWDEHIPYLMLAYRSAIHEYTGCTSAKVIFGKYLRLTVDLLLALGPTRGRGLELGSNDTGNLCEKLKRVHHYARNHLKLAFNSTTHKGRMA